MAYLAHEAVLLGMAPGRKERRDAQQGKINLLVEPALQRLGYLVQKRHLLLLQSDLEEPALAADILDFVEEFRRKVALAEKLTDLGLLLDLLHANRPQGIYGTGYGADEGGEDPHGQQDHENGYHPLKVVCRRNVVGRWSELGQAPVHCCDVALREARLLHLRLGEPADRVHVYQAHSIPRACNEVVHGKDHAKTGQDLQDHEEVQGGEAIGQDLQNLLQLADSEQPHQAKKPQRAKEPHRLQATHRISAGRNCLQGEEHDID
mmetsp:Transcript_72827/g.170872  ORF Transcript_72827/g.170872 Transcript_72827/m.170872 type:complete len:263 (-) Transcript_72827:850-1638(-)